MMEEEEEEEEEAEEKEEAADDWGKRNVLRTDEKKTGVEGLKAFCSARWGWGCEADDRDGVEGGTAIDGAALLSGREGGRGVEGNEGTGGGKSGKCCVFEKLRLRDGRVRRFREEGRAVWFDDDDDEAEGRDAVVGILDAAEAAAAVEPDESANFSYQDFAANKPLNQEKKK